MLVSAAVRDGAPQCLRLVLVRMEFFVYYEYPECDSPLRSKGKGPSGLEMFPMGLQTVSDCSKLVVEVEAKSR